jgi:hypothetical protein
MVVSLVMKYLKSLIRIKEPFKILEIVSWGSDGCEFAFMK